MPSKQRQTADTLVAAFNALDTTTIISLRTPNCIRYFLPTSLNLTPQSNEKYLSELNSLKQIFSSFQLTVNDVIEGPSDSGNGTVKIVMFVSALGQTPVGEYKNEYVWKMGFDKGGERIAEWEEYVDVGMVRDFFPKLKGELRRRAEEGQKEGQEKKEKEKEKE